MYANVIVDISLEKLDKTFQYSIPEALKELVQVGVQVRIPFGRGTREITGYVTGITDTSDFDEAKIKDILAVENSAQTIESRLIALAAWIREQYGSTMNQALKTVLPVKSRIKEKHSKTIVLSCELAAAEEYLAEARQKKYYARQRLLEELINSSGHILDYTYAIRNLKVTGAVMKPLEKAGILEILLSRVYRGTSASHGDGNEDFKGEAGYELNRQQQAVIEEIQEEWLHGNRPCLIHGVTGSGKTMVYMELIRQVLDQGGQAIVLIPEIALTYQILSRFHRRFGDKVAVLHSRLSQGERSDQMEQAKAGTLQVMVGPRSALFTPFPNLKLIIIDEEHESSYKSESMPRYHARDVALKRCEMEGAHLVLGSATPSVDSYYRAFKGEYICCNLEERFEGRSLPRVSVVDMRRELKEGNRSIISGQLRDAMGECLGRGEQIMLFLNRRGYSGFVSCRSCGYVAKCPHCDVSMSAHKGGMLVCHYCGYTQREYTECPSCGSPFIGGFKAGTQQIEEIVGKMFPQSTILRMDFDTTKGKGGHERILKEFDEGEADILIGTQMIVKGHDFPKVTLVGVLAADLSLNATDYGSGERTFQLITQAVGRAGRGGRTGEAYVQTYQPDHYCIQAAITQDYRAFYEEEMVYRDLMEYPPVSHMMAIMGMGEAEGKLTQAMGYLKEFVLRLDKQRRLKVIGPAPESIGKIQDQFRQVIYVKHNDRRILTLLKDRLEEYIEANSGFRKMNIQFDFHR